MTKRPTGPFWDASHNAEPEKSQLQGPLDLNPPRDKDNADHTPKPPTFVPGGATNKAARGAMGYRKPEGEPKMDVSNEIEIIKGDPEKGAWIHGKITSMEGYYFRVNVQDLPSGRGIDGGKITHLAVNKDTNLVAFYSHGWGMEPARFNDHEAVDKVRQVFDPPNKEFTPLVPKSNDQDQGHER